MAKEVKRYIYSSFSDEYIDIMNIAEMYIFNDFPESDAGYFALYATLGENGHRHFDGKILWSYCDWDMNALQQMMEIKYPGDSPKVKLIGKLYVKPNNSLENDYFWDDLWDKVTKSADKIAKQVYENQNELINEKKKQSIRI